MNFSRFTFFEAFVKNIASLTTKQLKFKKQSVCDEIDFQINRIYSKQKGGYWPVTNGDKVFISYMNRLKNVILTNSSSNTFSELAASAKEQAENKIKVVFLAQDTSVWPSFQSVYEVCVQENICAFHSYQCK